MHQKLGIATRFYGLTEGDVQRLATWVDAALAVVPAENVYVAIHTKADLSGSQEFLHNKYPTVTSFSVTPWGRVALAPNTLLVKSAERQMSHLLFATLMHRHSWSVHVSPGMLLKHRQIYTCS